MIKFWMIFTQVLMVFSLVAWAGVALMSVMAFDSGFSASAVIFVGVVLAYPLLPLGCAFMSWYALSKGNGRAAVIWTTAPFLIVAAVGIAAQIHG